MDLLLANHDLKYPDNLFLYLISALTFVLNIFLWLKLITRGKQNFVSNKQNGNSIKTIANEVSEAQTREARVKRYISWDEYFMAVANLAARRSKDPSTQVGACIVNENNKIIGSGYNGMPNGVDDKTVPWSREGSYLETKYAYVVHAELNAILNCVLTDQSNCRIYVSLFPCNECAKAIIQSGIKHVIYLSDKHKHKDSTIASKRMFDLASVRYEAFDDLVC